MKIREGSEPLRLLLWYWGRRGGGPRYALELARALASDPDFDLRLSLSRQSELFSEFEASGIPLHTVNTYAGKASAAFSMLRLPAVRRDFLAYLRLNRIDTVVCTMSHLWNAAMLGAIRRSGARYMLVLHDAVPHPGENFLVRRWLLAREIAAADGVIALSEHVRDRLCGTYAYPRERTWVVPHGVFAYHVAARARAYPRRPFRLMFFGRLLPYKGLDLLLPAFRRLRALHPGVQLRIAGPGDGARYLRGLESEAGVAIDNRWIPESEIASMFEAADLLILPYTEASQSGVIAAAYAAAVPVVATPVGGLVEQVHHEVNGIVAEQVTPDGIVAAVHRLVSSASLYERCSRGALETARDALAWPGIAARFSAALHALARMPERR